MFFNSFIKRPSGAPVIEEVEFIFLTHCSKERLYTMGKQVRGGSEGGISGTEYEKEPNMNFGLWLGNLGAGLRSLF